MTTIRKMAPEELESFRDYSIRHEAAAISADEGLSEAEALAIAQREFDELLPLGLDTPNSFPMAIVHSNETVGCLWFQKEETEGVPQFFLCDFVIFPAHRRRGYAASALCRMEDLGRKEGAAEIVLFVADSNPNARRLYEKCGYEVHKRHNTGWFMKKNL